MKLFILITFLCCSTNIFSQSKKDYNENPKIDNYIDSTFYYNWDTLHNRWKEESKRIYKYDINGNRTETYFYNKRHDKWIIRDSYIAKYDLFENIIFSERLDYFGIKYITGGNKAETSYDNNNNIITHSNYTWDLSLKQWKGNYRKVYQYDSLNNSKQSHIYNYSWDKQKKDWVQSKKSELLYLNDTINKIISFEWENSTMIWKKISSQEHLYDEDKHRIQSLNYSWSNNFQNWIGRNKTEYKYNLFNKEILQISYDWDTLKNDWSVKYKIEKEYDVNKNLKSLYFFNWNHSKLEWIYSNKTDYTYKNDNKVSSISYKWDSSINYWIKVHSINNFYDTKGNLSQKVSLEFKDSINYEKTIEKFDINGQCTLNEIYQWISNQWELKSFNKYVFNSDQKVIYSENINIDITSKTKTGLKRERTYNSKGDQTIEVSSVWNNIENKWDNKSKSEIIYDENEYKIQDYSYEWDLKNNLWKNKRKSLYYNSTKSQKQ